MTIKQLQDIFMEGSKAINYLRKHDCIFVASSIPTSVESLPDARLAYYLVGGATQKMIFHVQKTYPEARIMYTTKDEVASIRAYRLSILKGVK